jgi:hypothetical protein
MSRTLKRPLQKRFLSFIQANGFLLVLFAVVIYFSFAAQYFLNVGNFLAILHATAPLLIVASGLAVIVMTGKIDISVGSTAFLSTVVGMKMLYNVGITSWLSFLLILLIGSTIGALNAAIIVYLKVSPLVTTLASMIALRGVALTLTGSMSISLPEDIRVLGNAKIGPVFVDVILAFLVMLLVHGLITRTTFGRQVIAVGNDEETASKVGINVTRVTFLSFVLSGFLASLSGVLMMVQVGSITSFLGQGLEFTAVAVVVIGGISLYGGSGAIFPGVLLGALTLEVVRNGLNQVGADPYFYKIITGLVIFVAIYAFSLKRFVRT